MPENAPIYEKYAVFRTDGTDNTGGKHEHCTTFVLDLHHDPAVPAALHAFADACEADRPLLAESVREMLLEHEANRA